MFQIKIMIVRNIVIRPFFLAPSKLTMVQLMWIKIMWLDGFSLFQDEVGVKPEFCHMIGHSLGAHLAGYVGSNLKTNFGLTLGRITGW